MTIPPRRKGAIRRSAIPPDILLALNEGREETITLVEWLAIDMRHLLHAIVPAVGLADELERLDRSYDKLDGQGVTIRLRGIGAALWSVARDRSDRDDAFEALASPQVRHGPRVGRVYARVERGTAAERASRPDAVLRRGPRRVGA